MAKQTFNTEIIPQLKTNIEGLDELISNLKKGMENTVEICEESGSPKLIASGKSALEGVDNIIISAKELKDSFESLLKQYEKLDAAL